VVKWSIPAKQDLKKVFDYIARDSKFYAALGNFDKLKK